MKLLTLSKPSNQTSSLPSSWANNERSPVSKQCTRLPKRIFGKFAWSNIRANLSSAGDIPQGILHLIYGLPSCFLVHTPGVITEATTILTRPAWYLISNVLTVISLEEELRGSLLHSLPPRLSWLFGPEERPTQRQHDEAHRHPDVIHNRMYDVHSVSIPLRSQTDDPLRRRFAYPNAAR